MPLIETGNSGAAGAGGALPAGTADQTLVSNGAAWVASSFIENDLTRAAVNRGAAAWVADVPWQMFADGSVEQVGAGLYEKSASANSLEFQVYNVTGAAGVRLGTAGTINHLVLGTTTQDAALRVVGGAASNRLWLGVGTAAVAVFGSSGSIVVSGDPTDASNGTDPAAKGQWDIRIGAAARVGLHIRGFAAQSGNYITITDSSALAMLTFGSTGTMNLYGTAAQIQPRKSAGPGFVAGGRYEGTAGAPVFPGQGVNVAQLIGQISDKPLGTYTSIANISIATTDSAPSATFAGGRIILSCNSLGGAVSDEVMRLFSNDALDARVGINGTANPTSNLQVTGSFAPHATRAVAAANGVDVTILSTDFVLMVSDDSVTDARSDCNPPAASSCPGRIYVFKRTTGNIGDVRFDATGVGGIINNIGGTSNTATLTTAGATVWFHSDGSTWNVIMQMGSVTYA